MNKKNRRKRNGKRRWSGGCDERECRGIYDVQPGAGKEWIIHNVYTGAEAEAFLKKLSKVVLAILKYTNVD